MDDYLIGDNVRALRKTAGLSQAKLAEKMRESGRSTWWQNTVSRVEHNTQPVEDLEDLEALDDILGGGVLRGTPLGDKLKGLGDRIVWMNIETRLNRAEAALSVAQHNLSELRELVTTKRNGSVHGLDQEA